MTCFRIPNFINHGIKSMCAKFWWRATGQNKKVHWKTWNFLKRPKALGCLGFRDLTHFNKALLAKQIWRVMENPESLVARVLKARYFKHTDIMEATLSSNPSYIWRSMLWSRDIIREGIMWKVGNGQSINARRDVWIPSLSEGRIKSNISYDSNILLKELLSSNGEWNISKANSLFLPFEVKAIQRTPIMGVDYPDRRFWRFDKSGTYSVKSGYWNTYQPSHAHETTSTSVKDQSWNIIWNFQIPPKVNLQLKIGQ